mmetsp:Transcript_14593/g.23759  ORF Transcript_14593/g.23759 Transcript_14593/m.23759 type:complete len:305 (-) Transcript_14593:317-1231(-)
MLRRVVVCCGTRQSVTSAANLFVEGLGFEHVDNNEGPTLQQTRPIVGSAVRKTVTDGNVDLDFVCVNWLSWVRRLMRNGESAQIVSVEIADVPSDCGLNVPTPADCAKYLQPMAWLRSPRIRPMILPTSDSVENGHLTTSYLKEIAIGESDCRLRDTSSLISSMGDRLLPGVIKFGTAALRVYPSPISSIVVRVADLQSTAEVLETIPGEFNCQNVRKGSVRLHAPMLNGLDIRLTESVDFERQFAEARESQVDSRSAQFTQHDVSSMSCTAVSGLEIRTRLYRLPRQIMVDYCNSYRPIIKPS